MTNEGMKEGMKERKR